MTKTLARLLTVERRYLENHPFSSRTTPSHPEPPLLIQNHPFSFRTTPSHQNHPFSSRATPSHPEPPPLIQNHPFSFRTTPSHSEPPLLIQNHPFSFRTTPSHQNHPFSFRTTPSHPEPPLLIHYCLLHSRVLQTMCTTLDRVIPLCCIYIHVRMYVQAIDEGCTYARMYTV